MKIAVFTTTRAEFGILLPLIRTIERSDQLDYLLFAGGTHMNEAYGNTVQEIRNSGVKISSSFDFIPDHTDPQALVRALATETGQMAEIFSTYSFDAVCILGDRYELLPVVMAAILYKKSIIHIHGGERSEGAIDEQVRHMLTKSAHIHFAACEAYANNIRRMGEQAWRVHNTGALAADNMKNLAPVPKQELFAGLHLDEKLKTVILSYHPVSFADLPAQTQIRNLFKALGFFDYQVIITAPGADADREIIVSEIRQVLGNRDRYHYFESLGSTNYLNLIPHCRFVIGNSSSGIIEVPYYRIPTINVGSRQEGRLQHPSVINAGNSVDSIKDAISLAENREFRSSLSKMEYLFGNGRAAHKMAEILPGILQRKDLLKKKLVN